MKLLVTGGTGHLGRHVVRAATEAGHAVRVASRKPRPAGRPTASDTPAATGTPEPEWIQLDLAAPGPESLRDALAGIDAIVHAASDARHSQAVDVEGSRRLFEAAQQARVAHLLFVSIVGIDRNPLPYYRHKLATEGDLAASGLPHSILRATQFHWFVDFLLGQAARASFVMLLPSGFHVQPVAEDEVAARIVRALAQGPGGRLRDFAGPEPMTLRHATSLWKGIRRVRKPVIPVWLPGGTASAFRAGSNLATDAELGTTRWKDWLRANPQSRSW